MLINMITLNHRDNHGKMPNMWKRSKNCKENLKMAGKPDKKGKRTQLTIALYDCCGKTFREVVDKKKI